MIEHAIIGAGGFGREVKAAMGIPDIKFFVDDKYEDLNNNILGLSKFDPKKFQNKWEAKITYMLLHVIADVEELTEKVKLQERKIEYLKEVNGNKSVH